MASVAEPNLFDIPPSALRPSTLMALSSMLNPPKVIPAENGLPRDWRGLVHLLEIPRHLQPHASSPDAMKDLMQRWTEGSLGLLLQFLKQMDRWDVVDDLQTMMESDAVVYMQKLERASSTASALSDDLEKQILTNDDVLRLERGLPPQRYNAYLLYADPDEEFAVRIIEEMEQKYGLKLCVKDRDLVGGMFQHEAIMKLISERCNRLIVVISEAFLKSEANKFFCNFAQALAIEHKLRKVIPVMHTPCRLPPELNYFFVLDYTRSGQFWDFWEKLRDSLETPTSREGGASRVSGTSTAMLQAQEMSTNTSRAALLDSSSNSSASAEQVIEKPKPIMADISRNYKFVAPEGERLKKSSRSLSLENIKARSKKLFGSFPHLAKKNKKPSREPVPC